MKIVSERKRKRRTPFDLFGFDEDDFLFGPQEFKLSDGGSGYSISVTYDEKGKPVVKVQTYGDVDTTDLRRDIEQRYPGAKIEGLEKRPLIRVVEEKTAVKEETRKKKEIKRKEEKKKPIIRIIE